MSDIPVLFPEHVWGRLATEAHLRGVSIPDLIVAATQHLVRPPTSRKAHVVHLARAGFTDKQIAATLGETLSFVATTRRRAGVPANREQKTGRKTS